MFNFKNKAFAYLGSCPEIYLHPTGKNYIVVTSITVTTGILFTHVGFGCKILKDRPISPIDLHKMLESPVDLISISNEPTYIAEVSGVWWSKSCKDNILKSLNRLYRERIEFKSLNRLYREIEFQGRRIVGI